MSYLPDAGVDGGLNLMHRSTVGIVLEFYPRGRVPSMAGQDIQALWTVANSGYI
jgi:hypothetical protein